MSQLPFLLSNCSISRFISRHNEPYEGELLKALQEHLKDGGLFIDVGAHVGNHTIAILQNTPAEVISFEPNSEAFKALAGNVLALGLGNRVEINNLAVGEKKSTGELSPIYPDEAGSMSLLSASNGGQAVDIVNLDSLLPKLGKRKPTVIKVDTEGYELFVVKGALDLIQKFKPILCLEMSSVEQFDTVVTFMSSLSYVPVSIFNATPTLIWLFDENASATDATRVSEVYRYAIKMALEKNSLAASSAALKAQVSAVKPSAVLDTTVVTAADFGKTVSKKDKKKTSSSIEIMSALKNAQQTDGVPENPASSIVEEKKGGLAEKRLLKAAEKSKAANQEKIKKFTKVPSGSSKDKDVFDIVKQARRKN